MNFIMLVGLPGSGKSTFARNFIGANEYTYLSTDALVEAWARNENKTYDDVWGKYIKDAETIMNEDFRQCIADRRPILWDQTNLTPKKRRKVLSQLPRDYAKSAIFFEIDENERQMRLSTRVGKTVPDHVQQNMRNSYVRPTTAEGFDSVVDGVFGSVAA